jgi:spoIIIJ-associated protein
MKKFEAPTLTEACSLATKEYNCSLEDIEYNIIQYPKKGLFGLFSKRAIIEVINFPSSNNTENREPNSYKKESDGEFWYKSSDVKEYRDSETIVNSFFSSSDNHNQNYQLQSGNEDKKSVTAIELERKIRKLMDKSCFNIDTVEVDIKNNTAYVFLDGEDAALLIGKEGYRYNALSYILFNWINAQYGLFLKLEIAEFFSSQRNMVINLLQPVVEHVKKLGWGKTKPLDGILIQIALEYLRETFPNKYVAIKKQNNLRYIIISDFNTKI